MSTRGRMQILLWFALISACLGRTDLRVLKQGGDECVENAECPEACIGQRCEQYASGGSVCDDYEDCQQGFQCPDGFCRGEEGVGCTSNAECLEACINGSCTVFSTTDGPCDEADDCAPGHECTAGACEALPAVCGNGAEEAGEACDDGNTVTESCAYGQTSCVVCDAACQEVAGSTSYCGDNITDASNGETCDDGVGTNSDAWAITEHCNATCTGPAPYCGDTNVDEGFEACEGTSTLDCNAVDGAYYTGTDAGCILEECTWDVEACSYCGDGTVDPGFEECDDNDQDDGDGCDSSCLVEPGWSCLPGSPTECYPEPGPEFVLAPPGTFTMGSPVGEEGRNAREVEHQVTLTRAFWIQQTEVTQNQFETVMGWNPSHFGPNGSGTDCGGDCPVEQVSWFDMVAYMNELSNDEGLTPCYVISNVECVDSSARGADYMACMNATQLGINSATVTLNGVSSVYDCIGYRLPTEAEWEYAARAGTTAATYNVVAPHFGELAGKILCETPHETLDPIAWFCGNDSAITEVVGQLQANPWGLYDMLGNVSEWCWDRYEDPLSGPITDPEGPSTGSYRVYRGGSCGDPAWIMRAAWRYRYTPDSRWDQFGGRPARSAL